MVRLIAKVKAMEVTIYPRPVKGCIRIPASKSHTIRALLIATLAHGESEIIHPLESADTRSCLEVCRLLGAQITEVKDRWFVKGVSGHPQVPQDVLNTGNSGTTLYLALSAAALASGYSVFTGDEQIRRRPVDQLLKALRELGAEAFSTRNNGLPPVVVRGPIKGGKASLHCPTSQYLSSLLLGCPLAQGTSEIEVLSLNERPYIAMTLQWLKEQDIKLEYNANYTRFLIPGHQSFKPFSREIPADFSSATFFACLAAIKKTSLTLVGLDLNDTQGDKAVFEMLKKMGAEVSVCGNQITITGRRLQGQVLDLNATPDAVPALAVTACFAEGCTELVNVAQARLKETDRLKVMKTELTKMGAKIEERPDGLVIEGTDLKGCRVNGHSDHRVVMALAIAGLAATGPTVIETAEAAKVTFPNFFELLKSIEQTDNNLNPQA